MLCRSFTRHTLLGLWAISILSASLPKLSAQIEWDNGGGGSNWTTGANWVGDTAPTSANTTYVTFNNGGDSVVDTNNPWVVNRIDFLAGYFGGSLSGNQIQFAGTTPRLEDYSNSWQTLSNNIDLASDLTIYGTAGTGMTLNGVISGSSGITLNVLSWAQMGGSSANTFTGDFTVLEDSYFGLSKSSGVVAISGDVVLGSGSTSNGALYLYADGQIADSSTVTIHHGSTASDGVVLQLNGNAETIKGLISTGGGAGTPTVRNALAADDDATLTIDTDGSSYTYNGILIDGHASAVLHLTKTGSGTQTLGGSNTYTGNTTVSGGTLLLGKSEAISNSSNLILAGGTFATGGYDETLQNLTLTANSIIDLGDNGSGSHLHFTGTVSGIGSGAGEYTLSVWNWSGNPYGGDSIDSLFFSGATLDADALSHISFYKDSGTTLWSGAPYQIPTGSGGEVLPSVPEPSSWLTALGLVGLGIWQHRRRCLSSERSS